MSEKRKINFDHLSYSPILPEAKEAMFVFLSEDNAGNPLSRHLFGEKPRKALEESRQNVASLLNAVNPEEIVFTSCGSESNNLAIKGAALAYSKKGKHIIASPLEHHSVIHPLRNLEKQGFEISWLKADNNGVIDPKEIASLIRPDTIFVTITSASNEIGTLEPIKEIGKITREKGVLFHTDAVACAGFIPIDVNELNTDLLSIAGNIFYGPVGTGALYVKKGVRIQPFIEGGIQENGLRAGTHNLAGIAGMGVAARIAKDKLPERKNYLINLRDKLIGEVTSKISDCFLTGDRINRLPGHASFCVNLIEGESILLRLNYFGIAGTSGSTCSSEALKASHVLEAIGIDTILAQGSVSFCLGIDNALEDVEFFLSEFPSIVEKLRMMSPLTGAVDLEQFKYRKNSR